MGVKDEIDTEAYVMKHVIAELSCAIDDMVCCTDTRKRTIERLRGVLSDLQSHKRRLENLIGLQETMEKPTEPVKRWSPEAERVLEALTGKKPITKPPG